MPKSREEREALIRRYAEGPSKVAAALSRVPPEARKWRPGPGKWSVHEILCHCADSETTAAVRIRFLMAEPNPTVQGYDQDRWAATFDYHRLPLEPALTALQAVRAHTAALLRSAPESLWSKTGTHSDMGSYSAERWLEIYAEHLEKHSGQIDRTLAAWRSEETHPS